MLRGGGKTGRGARFGILVEGKAEGLGAFGQVIEISRSFGLGGSHKTVVDAKAEDAFITAAFDGFLGEAEAGGKGSNGEPLGGEGLLLHLGDAVKAGGGHGREPNDG